MPHSVSTSSLSSQEQVLTQDNDSVQSNEPETARQPDGGDDVAMEESRDASDSPALPDVQDLDMADSFDDDHMDDDEWLKSAAAEEAKHELASSAPEPAPAAVNALDQESLKAYYQRLFPFRYLFHWLNHSPSPTTDFGNREFAFTLQNDAYLRYQAFPTADLLRKEILRMNPSRFEIGPVYTANPRDRKTLRKSTNFKPLSKELVFDIDLTDYDEIRTCCDKANICHKCWSFVTMAVKVVDAALREDFGFKHILWVYSGRRGAHAWVCDKRAREMDDQKRKAIAGYLEVIKGGAQSGKKVNVRRPLHPHLSRSLDILKDHFQHDILINQDPWLASDRSERLLKLLPDKSLNESLRKKWDSSPGRSSLHKWADIDTLAKTGASRSLDAKALLTAKQDIVLEYTYPRLDVEVSKKLIHLLKSPFVVHPGTGRVCVPIDTRALDEFDPLAVPTVATLLAEIDAWDGEHAMNDDEAGQKEGKRLQDYEKTSLRPYVELFRVFTQGLMKEEMAGKREREDGQSESTDF